QRAFRSASTDAHSLWSDGDASVPQSSEIGAVSASVTRSGVASSGSWQLVITRATAIADMILMRIAEAARVPARRRVYSRGCTRPGGGPGASCRTRPRRHAESARRDLDDVALGIEAVAERDRPEPADLAGRGSGRRERRAAAVDVVDVKAQLHARVAPRSAR